MPRSVAAPAPGASPATGDGEATITFHNEPWTAEVARLLLEVDEGWVGYRNKSAWSWRDETFTVFSAVCRERKWPSNSLEACVAMLQALRTGAISMKLSNATRSSDGCAQWSLTEMRELGAQMRRVVDGQSPTMRWVAQLVAFVETMKARDSSYSINDRTVEDFAARAGKYVPEPVLLLVDPNRTNGKTTPTPRRTRKTPIPEPDRRVTRGQAFNEGSVAGTADLDSDDDEPLVPRRNPRTKPGCEVKRKGRKRSVGSEGDSTYHHDPTSENQSVLLRDETALTPEDESMPATQEITSQGELLPMQAAVGEQPTRPRQYSVNQGRPSLPLYAEDQVRPTSAARQRPASPRQDRPASKPASERPDEPTQQQVFPRQNVPVQLQMPPRQDAPAQRQTSPREDAADQARSTNGSPNGGTPIRQPSRKHQRIQQPVDRTASNGRASSTTADAPHFFRTLNPYDRPGKPWGEFVVEVLLAERMARNEDELDYVQFVRGLYEI